MATKGPEAPQPVVPSPDPTTLTNESVDKAIMHLRDLIEARLHGFQQELEALRIETALRPKEIKEAVETLRTLYDEKLRSLAELTVEKFHGVQTQFTERDTRTEQTSRDSKVAVDAALQAAKEAVGEQNKSSATAIAKSESATTKQIDQIGMIMNTNTTALNDKIDDLRNRLAMVESRQVPPQLTLPLPLQTPQQQTPIIGYALGALGVAALVILVIVELMRRAA